MDEDFLLLSIWSISASTQGRGTVSPLFPVLSEPPLHYRQETACISHAAVVMTRVPMTVMRLPLLVAVGIPLA